MTMFPTQRIYHCDEGGSCFICVGRDVCTQYRTVPLSYQTELSKFNNPCDGCPNRPMNGEFKPCGCTLPYFNRLT